MNIFPKLYCKQSHDKELFRGPANIENIKLPLQINTDLLKDNDDIKSRDRKKKKRRF